MEHFRTIQNETNIKAAIDAANEMNNWINNHAEEIATLVKSGFKIKNDTALDKRTMDKIYPILKGAPKPINAYIQVNKYNISLIIQTHWNKRKESISDFGDSHISTYIKDWIYLDTFDIEGFTRPKYYFKDVQADIQKHAELVSELESLESKILDIRNTLRNFQA